MGHMAENHSEYGWGHFPAHVSKLSSEQFSPHIYYETGNHPFSGNATNFGYQTAGVKMYADEGLSNQIGHLTWHQDRGEIFDINVAKKYRRKGVATAMYTAAKDVAKRTGIAEPQHSSDRSDMGEKWAKSTGEPLPERLRLTSPS